MKIQTAADKTEIFERKSPPRAIASMAVPTILSQIITIIYSLADTFFVGHTGDAYQVAALTLCFSFYMTLTGFGNLFGIGANSRISRFLGEGNRHAAEEVSAFTLWGGLTVTAAAMTLLAIFLKPLLFLVGASEHSAGHAAGYLLWTMLIGGLPTEAALLLSHMLRAEGNARAASLGMMMGGVLNIFLDPLFIFTFGMGVSGAGLATMLSNIVSLLYFILVLRKAGSETVIRPRLCNFTFRYASEVLLVGLPSSLVVALGTVGNLLMTRLMSAYGDVAVASYGVTQKFGIITMNVSVGLTQGIMPLIGYSYAAKDYGRVRSICRWSFLILFCFIALFFSAYKLFPTALMRLFLTTEETVSLGASFLKVWCFAVPGMTFVFLFNAIFQAIGLWKRSTFLSILRQGILFIPVMLIMNRFVGMRGLVLAQPIADTTALLTAIGLYLGIADKMKRAD